MDVEGKVLDMDMGWEIREMCRFRVSERGRVSALCVVFPRV